MFSDVLAIYEQPLDPDFHQLLEAHGPLPDPFNTVGRIRAEHSVQQREKELAVMKSSWADQVQIDTKTQSNNRQSFGRRGGRISLSPWDVSPFIGCRDQIPSSGGEALLGLGQITSCHKYIPPSSLHSLTATCTLPARVYVILTNKGIFLLQQQRFSDLYKNAALDLIAQSNESDQTSSQIDPVQSFCTPPSQTELQLVQSIISPQARKAVVTPALKLSLLNVFAATQLFSPEQVMAVIWQTLTGLYNKIPWPSIRMKSAESQDFSGFVSTPFNRRSDRLDASYRSTKRTTTPGLVNFDPSKPGSLSATIISSRQAFPWSFLIEILVTVMTDSNVHNDPKFRDCLYATISQGKKLTFEFQLF